MHDRKTLSVKLTKPPYFIGYVSTLVIIAKVIVEIHVMFELQTCNDR